MKLILIAMLCLTLSGCTSTRATSTADPIEGGKPAVRANKARTASHKKSGCREAMQAQSNAAMLGGALGMVGSFGGFGGRGGMVASHLASTAGSMVASSQSAKAHEEVMQECY